MSVLGRALQRSDDCDSRWLRRVLVVAGVVVMAACSGRPLLPYNEAFSPMLLAPLAAVGIEDERARFRDLLCEVNRQVGALLPDHRPCDDVLVRVGVEPESADVWSPLVRASSEWKVQIVFVPGLGWECLRNYVDESAMFEHVQGLGYRVSVADVEGLSSSARNAALIDNHLRAIGASVADGVVLIGYSKGVPDIMEFLQRYPQWQETVRAVVSVAGAVGGSPLAESASARQLRMFKWVPGAECSDGDGGALDSLHSGTRRQWLADNPLPSAISYYSLVTYPEPGQISRGLRGHYRKLSRIDARNDSQLLFYDQMLPSGQLLGFLNADHLAVAVPIARAHRFVGSTVLNRNAFPREVLMEAVVRYLEQDLAARH